MRRNTSSLWLLTPSSIEAEAVWQAALPVSLRVTGVGALATLHTLWKWYWEEEPSNLTMVGLGIAGSYRKSHRIPSVVYVGEEIWGDLGRRGRRFIPASDRLRQGFPLRWRGSPPPFELPLAVGLTLHTVSATLREARYWRRAYPEADIETQEGAAYFLFAEAVGARLYMFRVLSNRAGSRHWEREAALNLLSTFTRTHVAPLCERLLAGDYLAESG
ncbi:MAG: hypothetical protein N2253_07230 [Bacteroidia bacterium]|nr:hypothetical protein [Bacteroidia bacterium]